MRLPSSRGEGPFPLILARIGGDRHTGEPGCLRGRVRQPSGGRRPEAGAEASASGFTSTAEAWLLRPLPAPEAAADTVRSAVPRRSDTGGAAPEDLPWRPGRAARPIVTPVRPVATREHGAGVRRGPRTVLPGCRSGPGVALVQCPKAAFAATMANPRTRLTIPSTLASAREAPA
jgi:hypothetical protein